MQTGTKLTSVEVQEDLFKVFKAEAPRYKISFKNLVDRAMYLYLTDTDFTQKIHSQLSTKL